MSYLFTENKRLPTGRKSAGNCGNTLLCSSCVGNYRPPIYTDNILGKRGTFQIWAATSENVLTRGSCEDSDQPAHLRSPIRIFTGALSLDRQECKVTSCRKQGRIRLCGCAGGFEASLGAHARRCDLFDMVRRWIHEFQHPLQVVVYQPDLPKI